jgi:hypothetical protein
MTILSRTAFSITMLLRIFPNSSFYIFELNLWQNHTADDLFKQMCKNYILRDAQSIASNLFESRRAYWLLPTLLLKREVYVLVIRLFQGLLRWLIAPLELFLAQKTWLLFLDRFRLLNSVLQRSHTTEWAVFFLFFNSYNVVFKVFLELCNITYFHFPYL